MEYQRDEEIVAYTEDDLVVDGSVALLGGPTDITFTLGGNPEAVITFTNTDGKLDMVYDPDRITEASAAIIEFLKVSWNLDEAQRQAKIDKLKAAHSDMAEMYRIAKEELERKE